MTRHEHIRELESLITNLKIMFSDTEERLAISLQLNEENRVQIQVLKLSNERLGSAFRRVNDELNSLNTKPKCEVCKGKPND